MDFGNFNVTGYNSTGMAMPFSGGSGMDPISALIGATASLVGGFMNQNQQENASELNYQMNLSQQRGDYIPQYLGNVRRGADKWGFNPLAVLGQRFPGPTFAAGADTALGSSVAAAGQQLAEGFSPAKLAVQDLTLRQMKADTETKQINSLNAQVELARNNIALDELLKAQREGRGLIPPGWSPPSVFSDVRKAASENWPSSRPGIMLPGGQVDTMGWYDLYRKFSDTVRSSGNSAPRSWFHQE